MYRQVCTDKVGDADPKRPRQVMMEVGTTTPLEELPRVLHQLQSDLNRACGRLEQQIEAVKLVLNDHP